MEGQGIPCNILVIGVSFSKTGLVRLYLMRKNGQAAYQNRAVYIINLKANY
jgi:hypothetical protein